MTTVIGVRFKEGGKVYYFDPKDFSPEVGSMCIVETARGLECGTVALARSEVEDSSVVLPLKQVVRLATEKDVKQAQANREKEKEALEKQITSIGEKVIRNENVKNAEGLWKSWMEARVKYLTVVSYLRLVQFQFKILHISHMDETDPDVERKLIQTITVGPDGTVKVHFKGEWIFK